MPQSGAIGDDLVRKWQAGGNQDEIFRQLFAAYYPAVFNFFTRQGFARDESRDLAQETFLRVYTGLGRFRHESSFNTWLFQIAANLYRNCVRDRAAAKRSATVLALDEVEEERLAVASSAAVGGRRGPSSPLDGMLLDERSRLLHRHIESLPRQMRRCVLLRVDQQLKYEEIGRLMGITVGAVKAHLHQARQQLKVRLGELLPDGEL